MNRRAFLSWTLKGTATAAAAVSLPSFVFDRAIAASTPAAVAGRGVVLASFEDVVVFVGKALSRRVADVVHVAPSERRGFGAHGECHLLNIAADLSSGEEYVPAKLETYADMLAEEVTHYGVRRFGAMNLPRDIESACTFDDGRVHLRGLSGYDVLRDRYFWRFDVIGGPT